LAFGQQPTNVHINTAISPAVTVLVEDQNGNLLSSSNASVTLSQYSGPGSGLNGVLTASAVNGVATFSSVWLNTAGTYQIGAASSGLEGSVSNSFVVSAPAVPDLTLSVGHNGNFSQGDVADAYYIAVSNVGSASTTGTVTVTDTLPSGLTPTAADSGASNGWTLSTNGQTVTGTRSDVLTVGNYYPTLTVTVAVASNAPSSVTNTATVSGGGETNTTNDTANDTTTITPVLLPNLTPYQPTGWSDKIVVTDQAGSYTDSSPLYSTDNLYVDWAVTNNGAAATAATFYSGLSIDGSLTSTWYTPPPLAVGSDASVSSYSIGTLSAGTHTLQISVDDTNAINESNESDNVYTKTITVQPTPALNVSTTSLALPTTTQGTAGAVTSFTVSGSGLGSGDNVFLDAPTGCEISTSSSSGFGITVNLSPNASGNLSSTTVYARISASATASFSGTLYVDDGNYVTLDKSISVSGTVTSATATITTVTASANPGLLGETVAFTATVSAAAPSSVLPTGFVQFFDGGRLKDTETLEGGAATFNTSSLAVGSHSITAYYCGDANFQVGWSGILKEQINRPVATATTLTASANPAGFGQQVTFTATVKSKSGLLPGAVIFSDGGVALGAGTPIGAGRFTFTTSSLTLGTYAITASYSGDSVHGASTSAKLVETIKQAAMVTLYTSSNPSPKGQAVTFTVNVSGGSGLTPTGSVTLKDGTKRLGTVKLRNGQAIFKTKLAVGSHTITVVYAGDKNFAPASTVADQTVSSTIAAPLSGGIPVSASVTTAPSTATSRSLDDTGMNCSAIDAALRALLLDDSTMTGIPRALFES
jgi:uncharacterized repeat protein (TIGR01451 family)